MYFDIDATSVEKLGYQEGVEGAMLQRRWKVVFRGDSGYHNERAIKLFSEHAANYLIKAARLDFRHNFIQTSPNLNWTVEDKGVSYCSYMTNTKAGTKYRETYKRTRQEAGGQLYSWVLSPPMLN